MIHLVKEEEIEVLWKWRYASWCRRPLCCFCVRTCRNSIYISSWYVTPLVFFPFDKCYPLVNKQFDSENSPFLMETFVFHPQQLPGSMLIYQRVYPIISHYIPLYSIKSPLNPIESFCCVGPGTLWITVLLGRGGDTLRLNADIKGGWKISLKNFDEWRFITGL
jgi:hypothetical protein